MKRCIKRLATISFVFSLLVPTIVSGQTLKPNYLSEMPPPARIINETKGKDADAAQMKLAAAAILVQTKATAAQGVAILQEARRSAATEPAK